MGKMQNIGTKSAFTPMLYLNLSIPQLAHYSLDAAKLKDIGGQIFEQWQCVDDKLVNLDNI